MVVAPAARLAELRSNEQEKDDAESQSLLRLAEKGKGPAVCRAFFIASLIGRLKASATWLSIAVDGV